MPLYGCPIIWPVHSCWRYRPSSNIFISHEPADSEGGLPGSIHSFVLVVQLPSRLASCLCGSAGVASCLYISIMACGSICFSCFFSFAIASDPDTARDRHVNRISVRRMGPPFLIMGYDSYVCS